MPTPLYKVSLTQAPGYRDTLMNSARKDFEALEKDAEYGRFLEDQNLLEIFVEWGDFVARYPAIGDFAKFKGTSKIGAKELEKEIATPELAITRKTKLDNSRDALRNLNLPPTGQNDPANNTGVNPNMTPQQQRQAIMQNSGGFCQGRDHGQAEPLEMLTAGLDDDSLFPNGRGLLFIEEIPASLQKMLETWLDDGKNSELPDALKAAAAQQDIRMAPKTPFKDLLFKAKEKGIRVFGIDGGDATPGVENTHAGQAERRDVKMNALAKKVIDEARAKYRGYPVVASVGEAHMNHHPGGIPGIAQILGVPGITTSNDGKIQPVPDDPTLRGMPSKAVQQFIDGYIDALEAGITGSMRDALGGDKDAFKEDIYNTAKEMADRLVRAGVLRDNDLSTVDTALSLEVVKDQRDEYTGLIANWPKLATSPDMVGRLAVRAGSTKFLNKVVTDHPATLNKKDNDGRTLMHWAAMMGQPGMINTLADKGESLETPDKDGNRPLHLAAKRRRDLPDPRVLFQGDTVGALVGKNADVNATGEGGRTAMHWAALNNNTSILGSLGDNARIDIPDSRGWTAYDTALGSTKVEAEKWFYRKGKSNDPGVDQNSQQLDTVQALMRSVKCENPGKHQQQIEDAIKELYGNPDLRPMLDLLAKNSLLPRDSDGGGGVKIFIADKDNVGLLYNSVKGLGPSGAYDEGSHTVMVGGDGARDLAGELAHEFTHAVTRVAFGKEDVPYVDEVGKKQFLKAIEEDVRVMSLMMPGNEMEQKIKTIISTRLETTVRDYPDEADHKVLQEFAVSIPQLIAEYGSEQITKLAPGLMKFYRGNFTQALKTAGNLPKYNVINAKLDNTNLEQTCVPRQPKKSTWVDTNRDTVSTAINMLRSSYKAFHGKPTNVPKGGKLKLTIPFKDEHYQLDMVDDMAFELTMQRVEKAMRKAIREEGFPPELSADALRSLALELGQEIRSGKPVKQLDQIIQSRVTNFARRTKVEYVRHCVAENKPVSDHALAEATIIQAETLAWNEGVKPDGKTYLGVEVNQSKHKEMVKELTKSLGDPKATNAKQNPLTFLENVSTALSGDKNKGFYRKTDKKGVQSTEHVSLSVKDAKKTWLSTL